MRIISVIIPCYNVEKFIDRTLESLKSQTIGFEQLEIICVDDCSTDNTLAHLKAWEKEYSNTITLVALDKNGRQGAARNIGLKYATCDYVGFIDSDDWLEKDYFKTMYDIANNGNYDLVQCEYVRDSSESLVYNAPTVSHFDQEKDISIKINTIEDRKHIFHQKIITNTPPLKLISRRLLMDHNILFSEGIAYEDSYWGILLNMYVNSAYLLKRPLYHYYINQKSTVLSKNELYHVDLLTNQISIWNELIRRGFMLDFKYEIEIEHVYSCALVFWKMLIYRYDTPPYSLYRLLCAIVQEHIPNIMNNPYIQSGSLNELHMLILKSCLNIMNKDEFESFADNLRKIGLT